MGSMKRPSKRPTMSRFYSGKYQAKIMRQIVQKTMNKNVETKTACYSTTDGNQIAHNNFISMTPQILATTQGVQDPTTSNQDCRIGDEIKLKGVSLKMMVELNERYSDVTFRLLVIKAAKGDVPTRATLFNGLSQNKMMDTINTERYTVMFQKYFKMRAPGHGVSNGSGGTTEVSEIPFGNAGIEYAPVTYNVISKGTKIVKVWIPGRRFARSGIIKYEHGSSQPKFFDYHVLLYAYSNYVTNQDVWNVARLNEYVQQLYYKDA